MFCGNCGTDNPVGTRFCKKCGTPVSSDPFSQAGGGNSNNPGGGYNNGGYNNGGYNNGGYNNGGYNNGGYNNGGYNNGGGYPSPFPPDDRSSKQPKKKNGALIVIIICAVVLIAGIAGLVFLLLGKGGSGGCKDPEDLPAYFAEGIRDKDIEHILCGTAPKEYWDYFMDDHDADYSDLESLLKFSKIDDDDLDDMADEAEENLEDYIDRCYDKEYKADKSTIKKIDRYLQDADDDLEVEECYERGDDILYCVNGRWYFGSMSMFESNTFDLF